MGTEITAHLEREHHVARALAQLTHSRLWPNDSPRDLEAIERAIDELTEKVNPVWLMARIAALLNPYYEKDVPQVVREIEAEDWAAALGEYPQWAVEKATRWWKSMDNPRKHLRPIEGDIQAKCHDYLDGVRAGQRILASGQEVPVGRLMPAPDRTPVSREVAADILARAGFAPRRV